MAKATQTSSATPSAHTPGPWVIPQGSGGRAIRDRHGNPVAVSLADDNDEAEANTRLIAAAPDLLAFATFFHSGRGTPAMLLGMSATALAKAKGRAA